MRNAGKSREGYFQEYAAINGIRQYFLHIPKDSDFVILFLHGGPGQSEALFAYKTILPENACSVVYYDQRGAGRTQLRNKSKPGDITLPSLLRDLDETVRYIRHKYPNQKIILLGHSWGSILGLEYVKQHGPAVDAYVGMGQVVNFMAGERAAFDRCYSMAGGKDQKKLTALDYPGSASLENFNKKVLSFRKIQAKYKLAGARCTTPQLLKVILKSPAFSPRDIQPILTSLKTNAALLEYLEDYDTSGCTEFSIPIFFICGREDWQVPSVVAEQYYGSIAAPRKGFYWIENAGHLTDLDNPAAYTNALNEIRSQLSRSEATDGAGG